MLSEDEFEQKLRDWTDREDTYVDVDLDPITPVWDKIPKGPISRFFDDGEHLFRFVLIDALDDEVPRFAYRTEFVVAGEGADTIIPKKIRSGIERDWGYESYSSVESGSMYVVTDSQVILLGCQEKSIRGMPHQGNWDVADVIPFDDISEIFYGKRLSRDDTFGVLQIHTDDYVYCIEEARWPLKIARHIADAAELGDHYKIEGPVDPNEEFLTNPPRHKYDYGWGYNQRTWDDNLSEVDIRKREKKFQEFSSPSQTDKEIQESREAHQEAQDRSPPVDIGDVEKMGVTEITTHHSGKKHAIGKIRGFTTFVTNAPSKVDVGDIIRVKIMSFNQDENSADAHFVELL
jgi:predicted RNA-binding protein with TRAM domain